MSDHPFFFILEKLNEVRAQAIEAAPICLGKN